MSFKHFVAVFVLTIFVKFSIGKHLPSFIKPCKYTKDDTVLGECIVKNFLDNQEEFVKGVPEMHVPGIDPFHVDRIDFNTGNGSAVGINAIFTNVKIDGTRNMDKMVIKPDLEKNVATLDISFPHLRITSDYVINGRIMVLPINGTGKADGNFTNVHAFSEYTGKIVTRHNKKYMDWVDQKINLSIGGATMYFDDLFNGNKELTDTTNKVINENSNDIINELKPLVEETISAITFSVIRGVFHTYSIDELFARD